MKKFSTFLVFMAAAVLSMSAAVSVASGKSLAKPTDGMTLDRHIGMSTAAPVRLSIDKAGAFAKKAPARVNNEDSADAAGTFIMQYVDANGAEATNVFHVEKAGDEGQYVIHGFIYGEANDINAFLVYDEDYELDLLVIPAQTVLISLGGADYKLYPIGLDDEGNIGFYNADIMFAVFADGMLCLYDGFAWLNDNNSGSCALGQPTAFRANATMDVVELEYDETIDATVPVNDYQTALYTEYSDYDNEFLIMNFGGFNNLISGVVYPDIKTLTISPSQVGLIYDESELYLTVFDKDELVVDPEQELVFNITADTQNRTVLTSTTGWALYNEDLGMLLYDNATITLDYNIWGEEVGEPIEPSYADVYLRGDMNGWGVSDEWKFNTTDGVTYTLTGVSIEAGVEFKVANADWSEINYGGVRDMKTNVEYGMVYNAENCTLAKGVEDATVVFNLRDLTIKFVVEEGPAPEYPYMIDPSINAVLAKGGLYRFDPLLLYPEQMTALMFKGNEVYTDMMVDNENNFFYFWNGLTTYQSPVKGPDGYDVDLNLLITGADGWSGAGFFVGAPVDLSHFSDKTRFHIAYRTDNAPESVGFILCDKEGDGTPANISVGNAAFVDNGATFPQVGCYGKDGEWAAIDLSLAELRSICPAFSYDNLAEFTGNILALLAGGVEGTTISLDSIFFYTPLEAEEENAEVYLRGEMNGWGTSDAWKFATTDGVVYTLESVSIKAGEEFKVADAEWGEINYGGPTQMKANVEYTLLYNGDNCTMAYDVENATLVFNAVYGTFKVYADEPSDPIYVLTAPQITTPVAETFEIPVSLTNSTPIAAYQCDVVVPEGFRLNGVSFSGRHGDSYQFDMNEVAANTVRLVCYSLAGDVIADNEGELFVLEVLASEDAGNYVVTVNNIVLTGEYGEQFKTKALNVAVTCEAEALQPGDANGDGMVNITDVVYICNYILGNEIEGFDAEYADINADGEINVTDIVLVVNYILNNYSTDFAKAPAKAAVEDSPLSIPAVSVRPNRTVEVEIAIENADYAISAMQFAIALPEGLTAESISLAGNAADSHVIASNMGRGICTVAAYSLTSSDFASGAVFTLKLTADSDFNGGDITLFNVVAAEADGTEHILAATTTTAGVPNGIDGIDAETGNAVYYNLQGVRLGTDRPVNGLYIELRGDKAGKVLVK